MDWNLFQFKKYRDKEKYLLHIFTGGLIIKNPPNMTWVFLDIQNINGNYAKFGILQIFYHIHIFNHVILSLNSYLYRFTTQRRVSKQDVWFPSLNSVHELDYSKLSNQHTGGLSSISLLSLSLHFYPSRFINYIVTHSKSLYCSISLFFLSLS